MHISELTKQYALKPREGPKIEFSFQEIGVEMQKEFHPKNVWPIFHDVRFTEQMIRDSFEAYKQGKVKTWNYFMGILLRKAGLKK